MADRQIAVRQERSIAAVPRDNITTISDERRSLWQQLFFEGATDADIEFCLAFCAHRDLDPLRGEVVFNKFQKKDKNGRAVGYTVTPVVTAIGYRVQASRTGDYLGQTPREWCGRDGVWKQVWLDDEPPAAARVGILRRGCPTPIYAVAVFKRFCKTWDGKPSGLWATHPDVMIATRAETAAFKLAFPETRRQDATPSRIVYRDAGDGRRLRTIDGAIAVDGGDVFEELALAEGDADRHAWGEVSREIHRLVAELHPEEPDAHGIVHELVCTRFGVDSTRDATIVQLAALRDELAAALPAEDGGDVIEVDAETGEITYGGDETEPPDVEIDPRVITKWLANIGAIRNVRQLAAIEKTVYGQDLDRVPAIDDALKAKRAELGLPDEGDDLAAVDRAVARTVAP